MARSKPKVTTAREAQRVTTAFTIAEDRKARLWDRYVGGASLSEIARDEGLSAEAIRAMFRRMGKTLRPATYREPAFYEVKAERLEFEAAELRKLAEALRSGVDPSTLLARTTGG